MYTHELSVLISNSCSYSSRSSHVSLPALHSSFPLSLSTRLTLYRTPRCFVNSRVHFSRCPHTRLFAHLSLGDCTAAEINFDTSYRNKVERWRLCNVDDAIEGKTFFFDVSVLKFIVEAFAMFGFVGYENFGGFWDLVTWKRFLG